MGDPFAGELGQANSQTPKAVEQGDPFASELTPQANKDYDSIPMYLGKMAIRGLVGLPLGAVETVGRMGSGPTPVGQGNAYIAEKAKEARMALSSKLNPQLESQPSRLSGDPTQDPDAAMHPGEYATRGDQVRAAGAFAETGGSMATAQVAFTKIGGMLDELFQSLPSTVKTRALAATAKIAESITSGAQKAGVPGDMAQLIGQTVTHLPKQAAIGTGLEALNPDRNEQSMMQSGALAVMNAALERQGNINLRDYLVNDPITNPVESHDLSSWPAFGVRPVASIRAPYDLRQWPAFGQAPSPLPPEVDVPDYRRRILDQITSNPIRNPGKAKVTGLGDLYRNVVSYLAGFDQLGDKVGVDLSHVKGMAQLTHGGVGKANRMMYEPFSLTPQGYKPNGQPGLDKIYAPIETQEDLDNLNSYVLSKQLQDKGMSKTSEQNVKNNNGETAKVIGNYRGFVVNYPNRTVSFSDLDAVKTDLAKEGYDARRLRNPKSIMPMYSGIDPADALKNVADIEQNHPEIAKAGQALVAYNQNLQEYAKAGGLMSDRALALKQALEENNVGIREVLDGNTETAKFLSASEAAKANTRSTIMATDKNAVRQALANMVDEEPDRWSGTVELIDKQDIKDSQYAAEMSRLREAGRQSGIDINPGDAAEIASSMDERMTNDNIMSVYRSGQLARYRVNPLVAETLEGMNPSDVGQFARVMGVPARIVSKLLMNPLTGFPEAHFFWQFFSATAQSKYGFKFGVDNVAGLYNYIKNGPERAEWEAAGGAYSSIKDALDPFQPKGKLQTALAATAKPFDMMNKFSNGFMNAAKLQEYILARKAGVPQAEAALHSRSFLGDYALRGSSEFMRGLTNMTAFSNPFIQAPDAVAKAFMGNKVGFTWKALASITIPSIALWYHNLGDKDIDAQRKSEGGLGYWFFKVPGSDHVYKFPKPPLLGQFFGTMAEDALDRLYQNNPQSAKQLGKRIAQESEFALVPTAFKMLGDLYANRDNLTGSPIVPRSLEGVDPQYQQTPNTSNFGKAVSKLVYYGTGKLANISPITMDYAIRSTLSDVGRAAMFASGNQTNMPHELGDYPFFSRWVAKNSSMSVEPISTFYDKADEVDTYMKTAHDLYNKNRINDFNQYVRDNANKFALAPMYTEARAQLRQMRNAIIATQNTDGLDAQTKREMTDYLTKESIMYTDGFNMAVARFHQ